MNQKSLAFLALVCLVVSANALNVGSILAVGDSITGGSSSAGSAPNSYRQYLDQMLHAQSATYHWAGPNHWGSFPSGSENRHAGMGGWDLDHILNGHSAQVSSGKLSDWLTSANPDTLLFMTPINGLWRWQSTYLTSQQTRDSAMTWNALRMRQVLDLAYSQNSSMRVFFASPTKIGGAHALAPVANAYHADLTTLVKTIVQDYQSQGKTVSYVAVNEAISPDGTMHALDSVHWSALGAQAGATEFFNAMTADPVPEPSLLGLLGLAFVRRRRRGSR